MKKLFLRLIAWYQHDISPHKGVKCRYHPTCSEYARLCFIRFNFLKASVLSLLRILRCNPLFKPKYDPPPVKKYHKKINYPLVLYQENKLFFKQDSFN